MSLVLDVNRKSYMGSLMSPFDLTLNDIVRPNSRSIKFGGAYIS